MERRLSKRIKVKLPVSVLLLGRQVCTMPSIDFSYRGLSFNCNYSTVQRIFPEGHRSNPNDKVNFTLRVKVTEDFMLECNAVVTRFFRLSEDEYHVGVQFIGLDNEAQHSLIHYVNNSK
ncbi:MAG: PilZ domain-containing protein [Gammaproteobacteria bacterium]|nr:PilZ domain-containing protein [Gammaproteobacteria bacterium]